MAHSSSINVESLKGAIIGLSNQGFSIAEIKALILQIEKQHRLENIKAEMRELSECIQLKDIYIDFKPAKSREDIYRDKNLSKSTWSTQKRPWIKCGTGRIRTKNNNDTRKNNKKTNR